MTGIHVQENTPDLPKTLATSDIIPDRQNKDILRSIELTMKTKTDAIIRIKSWVSWLHARPSYRLLYMIPQFSQSHDVRVFLKKWQKEYDVTKMDITELLTLNINWWQEAEFILVWNNLKNEVCEEFMMILESLNKSLTWCSMESVRSRLSQILT